MTIRLNTEIEKGVWTVRFIDTATNKEIARSTKTFQHKTEAKRHERELWAIAVQN